MPLALPPTERKEALKIAAKLMAAKANKQPKDSRPATMTRIMATRSRDKWVNLTVSVKSWHYTHLFIRHMRNDGCKRTV